MLSRSLAKLAFEVEDVELDLVQSYIQDVALLTATNIDDWNYKSHPGSAANGG